MTGFLSRAFSLLLVLGVVFGASRLMIRWLPGDPIDTLMAETGTSLPAETLRRELGLDRPWLEAIAGDFSRALLHGDLGTSLISRKPVAAELAERFFKTLELTFLAMALGVLISLAIGLLAASRPFATFGSVGIWADRFCGVHGALTAALPTAWIGPLMIYCLAVRIPLFPIGGHLGLPLITLALNFSGFWARLIRSRVREVLAHGAAPGARARGVPEWKVVLKYGFMPASPALCAYFGTQLGALLGGALVTEVIFDWQGMGTLLVESVLKRDYPVVEAAVFVSAAMALSFHALGDWAQRAIDPRTEAEIS